MDNPKARGQEHRRKLKKYRNPNKKGNNEAEQSSGKKNSVSTEVLISSSSEAEDTDTISDVLAHNDFSLLANTPANPGYFKLKSEKKWEQKNDSDIAGYFSVNLELLGKGLNSIPFYDRVDLDKNLFAKEEIEMFDRHACNKSKLYDEYLKLMRVKDQDRSAIEEANAILGNDDPSESEPQESSTENSRKGRISQMLSGEAEKETAEDLEKWLDDLLAED